MTIRFVPIVVILGVLASCDGPSEPEVSVSRIDLTPANGVLLRNQWGQFTATVIGGDGAVVSGFPVTWSSSDAQTVSVDGAGRVTAHWPGLVEITASAGGVTQKAYVRVDLDGVWTLKSVDGKALPAVVRASEPCPASASLESAPIIVEGGRATFDGDESSWWLDIGHDCGDRASYGSVFNNYYSANRSAISFTEIPYPGPISVATDGLLEDGRFAATLTDQRGGWPSMRLVFEE